MSINPTKHLTEFGDWFAGLFSMFSEPLTTLLEPARSPLYPAEPHEVVPLNINFVETLRRSLLGDKESLEKQAKLDYRRGLRVLVNGQRVGSEESFLPLFVKAMEELKIEKQDIEASQWLVHQGTVGDSLHIFHEKLSISGVTVKQGTQPVLIRMTLDDQDLSIRAVVQMTLCPQSEDGDMLESIGQVKLATVLPNIRNPTDCFCQIYFQEPLDPVLRTSLQNVGFKV